MFFVEVILARVLFYVVKELLAQHILSEKAKNEILRLFDERTLQAHLWRALVQSDPNAVIELRHAGGELTVTTTCPVCRATFDPLLPKPGSGDVRDSDKA